MQEHHSSTPSSTTNATTALLTSSPPSMKNSCSNSPRREKSTISILNREDHKKKMMKWHQFAASSGNLSTLPPLPVLETPSLRAAPLQQWTWQTSHLTVTATTSAISPLLWTILKRTRASMINLRILRKCSPRENYLRLHCLWSMMKGAWREYRRGCQKCRWRGAGLTVHCLLTTGDWHAIVWNEIVLEY